MAVRSDPSSFLPLTPLAYYLLLVLVDEPGHGYALVQRIRERSDDLVNPGTGSFYSIVQRTVDQGLIAEQHSAAPADTRRRVFSLTPLGRNVLAAEAARLRALVGETRRTLARPGRLPAR